MMNTSSKFKNDQNIIPAIGQPWCSMGTPEPFFVTNHIHGHSLGCASTPESNGACDAPGAVLVEVEAPSKLNDSLDLIRELRKNNSELVIVANINYSSPHAKTECYRSGADHCICAPNDPNKKEQLISVLLNSPEWNPPVKLTLDRTCLHLFDGKRKFDLAYQEVKVLEALINAQGNILHHDRIAESMGLNIKLYDSRVLEKSISRLRNKIKTNFGINIIHSVRGYGYRLLRRVISAK